jgi:hypothetical protein
MGTIRIKTSTEYITSDGKTFSKYEEAVRHDKVLDSHRTADQALDELMHGDTDALLTSCIAERKVQGLDQSVSLLGMKHAELANWWVTYMYFDEAAQSWLPKSMKEDDPFWSLNDLSKA